MDSILRNLYIKILTFNTYLLDVVGFVQTCLQNPVRCWCWRLAVSLSRYREDAL